MNISLVQTSSEIKLIEKNFEGEIIYLPVEMSALCYLKLNKLKYIDPIRYLKNDFHYESLKIVEKYILNLKNMDQKTYGENEEFKARIRFSLNASVFVISLLEEVLKKTKINKIIVSGWHGNNVSSFYSPSTFWISKIVFCLRHKFHIELVNKEKFSEKSYKKNFIYEIKKTKIKKNSILINNLGYNFKRIIISNIFRQHSIYFINFENLKINIVKKIFLKLFGLNIIEVKRIVTNTKLSLTEKLSFQYKDYDLSEFINSESLRAQYNLHNIKKKKESFSEFMFDNTFEYYLTCSMRGFDGAIVENLKRQNCKTICISHGTVSEFFNNNDKLYKKTISAAVFNGPADYFTLQTKIAKHSLKNTNSSLENTIETGNIIFANVHKHKKNKEILYATTLKGIEGTQLLGVEMFYEFIENLKFLADISKKQKFKFLVNLHPSHAHLKNDLQKLYPSLKILSVSISSALKRSFLTISFSSTVIEDSLCSFIPVILYDPQNRYKHCEAEQNLDRENSAIYYVNSSNDLIRAINTVDKSKSFEFEKYIFSSSTGNVNSLETNIYKNIKKILY